MTILHRCIASIDLAWVVQDNHLSLEASCFHCWSPLLSPATLPERIYLRDTFLTLKPIWKSFTQNFMVHFNKLDTSCNIDWSEGDHHAWFENTSLHRSHRDNTNMNNFVDVLEDSQRADQLDELVAGCSPELQAAWFHGHCHLYG